MITEELKQKVLAALKQARDNFYGSDAKFAVSIGISGAQYSRIKNGKTDKVLSDSNWITLARKFKLNTQGSKVLKLVKTPVFEFVYNQIETCHKEVLSYMLCDFSDTGKSRAAEYYAQKNKNAVYVDCSQVKTKHLFIRHLSKEFGLGSDGRYHDVYMNLVYYIQALPEPPIIILDEWGDVSYETFMESKAIWNSTDGNCAWYAIGAEGLEEKMRRGIKNRKIGYTEMFSRFGKRYGKLNIELNNKTKIEMLELTALMIIKANAPEGSDYNKILRDITSEEDGRPSLRRIKNELPKYR